ncbi:rRNA maturation RNase YbeY [Candidatus Parcubacteria bacterium]|uniref:Endoribonuclease YbeY n=1 Tax=Candidatus Kaiserbacteria bacterium CG10_big_fil_rev_8_21_14_0_10_47_16 TaxID=1974608 RepID=A0A2H0UCZ1_9BACT|nr:rRNA maturation RNase YbeY [Candidatus Parcubacteria bacterium]PIR84288.1 MAG: rRNA maturation RNase YbeY [Candidatus Kaiserbacteria bacterium CG10_big_fil_rev_8_21_14_0_10_47_16]
MKAFDVSATVAEYPKLPYEKIKNDILGSSYNLSLVFIGKTRAQSLNKTYRKKSYVPNVLSFPIEKSVGEIFITPEVAQREAKKHDLSYSGYIGFLFIHGLLHLKGLAHGDTMEKAEKRFISKYRLK